MTIENLLNPGTALSPSCSHFVPWGVAFGLTDIGLVRTRNEDNFLIDETLALVMVADGMGGHAAGAVASAAALVAVRQYLQRAARDAAQNMAPGAGAGGGAAATGAWRDPDATGSDPNTPAVSRLIDAIKCANTELHAQNLTQGRSQGGMGTTLTGVWQCASNEALIFFHVGDSRLYRCRTGALLQLTRDQTLYQQALDRGAIENLPSRNLLLQAVGPASDVAPEIRALRVERDDLLMLCSDGLHGSVPHGEIEQALAAATEFTLEKTCTRLIGLAKEYGSRDNITLLLVWCRAGHA